jgi:N-acetylneuraminate synthase
MVEVVLEVGINASGDLGVAKKLIDLAHAAGCHFVKFQKRDIDLVYSKEELNAPRESPWGTTNRQQKEGLEFGYKQYVEIDNYCKHRIPWFASPWDVNSVDFLKKFDVPFMKVPSARATDSQLLCKIASTGIPIILATGGCDCNMVDRSIAMVGRDNIYCIMQCTATYPGKPKEQDVMVVKTFKEKYPWAKIGFSNHYAGLNAMEMAVTLGADMIEFHATLDRTSYGSDQPASIEPRGVFELMEKIKLTEQMLGDGVKKIHDSEIPIMKKLRR